GSSGRRRKRFRRRRSLDGPECGPDESGPAGCRPMVGGTRCSAMQERTSMSVSSVIRTTAILSVLLLMAAPPAEAAAAAWQGGAAAEQERQAAQREREQERREREQDRQERVEDQYEAGRDALESGEWARAAERFERVAAAKAARVDAAMYWLAYAQSKLAQHSDALATLAELTKTFPDSRWMSDARALEMEVRQNAGQPVRPEAQADEDLKLLAIQGLQHSDPAQAVPMLQQFLAGAQSPRLKERALFVLAQSGSPQARKVLAEIARGASNPDIQRKAIQYLGIHGSGENRQVLAEIYRASTDV